MLRSTMNRFIEHLKQHLDLAEYEVPQPGEWSGVGNTIGALALRLGVLTVGQLEQILTVQEEDENCKRFGEVAMELGFLDREQVDQLLVIQRVNRCLELGEQLVVAGRLELTELLDLLRAFVQHENADSVSNRVSR